MSEDKPEPGKFDPKKIGGALAAVGAALVAVSALLTGEPVEECPPCPCEAVEAAPADEVPESPAEDLAPLLEATQAK